MNTLKNPLLIVANGDFPKHIISLKILKEAKSILACDGAADKLINNGYTPNIIIGDLDSISNKTKIKFSERLIEVNNQTENDLRKAINYAVKHSITDISIIGASGKREDHMIGNIFSLLNYKDVNIKLFTDTGVFTCIHADQKIESHKGQQVSIFSLDSTIKITSNNLKFNFNKQPISTLFSGTLNESKGDFFELKISHGNLIVFQTYA